MKCLFKENLWRNDHKKMCLWKVSPELNICFIFFHNQNIYILIATRLFKK